MVTDINSKGCTITRGYRGGQPGDGCHFPFQHNGQEFSGCISDMYHTNWCFVEPYAEPWPWGECETTCVTDEPSTGL